MSETFVFGNPSTCQGNTNNFLQHSAIPGNIGVVKARIMVWDNDPFKSRATQIKNFGFPMDGQDESVNKNKNLQFGIDGSIWLRPVYAYDDMFVAAIRTIDYGTKQTKKLDFVGSSLSATSVNIQDKLPGGRIYNEKRLEKHDIINNHIGKRYFPHQLWLHVGSLLDPAIYLLPSEYNIPIENTNAMKNISNENNRVNIYNKIEAAPRFDYERETINGKRDVISPIQITKKAPGSSETCHWTLEKYTPVWQGIDFFVSIVKNDKGPDSPEDPSPDEHNIKILHPQYAHLMYHWTDINSNNIDDFIPGISNEAFYVPPNPDTIEKKGSEEAKKESLLQARKEFYWKYKHYILVEIGVQHKEHNYFIELCQGRNPRFLHLGEEWDNVNRTKSQENQNQQYESKWKFIKKCRVLSVCNFVSSDELFAKDKILMTVRNHLGKIVITFEGYENKFWVINRLDTVPHKIYNNNEIEKTEVPIVVPSGKIRIHGGNLSCKINWSPLTYMHYEHIDFNDIEFDTYKAQDKDIYVTFAHLGCPVRYRKEGEAVKNKYFYDERFEELTVGYDCDAHSVVEIHRNKQQKISLYRNYPTQYNMIGKGLQTYYIKQDNSYYNVDIQVPGKTSTLQLVSITQRSGPCFITTGGPVAGSGIGMKQVECPATENLKLPIGLPENEFSGTYEYKDMLSIWGIRVQLFAGDIELSPLRKDEAITDDVKESAYYSNAVTPIARSWRIFVLGGEKPFQGKIIPFDIAPLVINYREEWSAEEFYTLNHSAEISCYIPPKNTPPLQLEDGSVIDIYSLGQKIASLIDKTFYLSISYWWDTGIGIRQMPGNILNPPIDSSDPLLIQMTGLAYGGRISVEANKNIFSFKVFDYSDIMAQQYIFNSPFFDAVPDVIAIYELAKLAGFDDDKQKNPTKINRKPLSFLQRAIEEQKKNPETTEFIYNGEKTRSEAFALKGSYADIANPAMKFKNETTILEAVREIAKLAGKTVYFDRWGVLRYETLPSVLVAYLGQDDLVETKMQFVTTPHFENFQPSRHSAHLVYQVASLTRSVQECMNHIIVMSAGVDVARDEENKPLGGYIIEGYTFYDQIFNPEAEGFIGYRKPALIFNGLYGGVNEVRNALKTYAKLKYPPIEIQFETYGVPGLKAFDIISLDNQLLWIKSITHEIKPDENKWWMNITGEWYKPYKGELSFLQRGYNIIEEIVNQIQSEKQK